jgi:acetylornithine aminotransferase
MALISESSSTVLGTKNAVSYENLIPTHNRLPVAFTHGQGVWVWDESGRKYLDGLAGIAVNSLGHAHPRLTHAISEQAGRLIHVSNNYRIPVQARLATRLAELSGMRQVFFTNSGTEANECAIKLARLFGHKRGIAEPKIVVMEKAFHGRTLGSLSATAKEDIRKGFGPLLGGFVRVPFDDPSAIEAAAQDPDVVAVLLEVVQGEGGINLFSAENLQRVQHLSDQRNILLMIDEIQTGIGRTGSYFAFQHAGIVPDVITLAKGLGGGVPIGACVVGEKAMDIFSVGSHGSTFGGNPLVCAAASAVLDVMQESDLCKNAAVVGAHIRQRLKAEFEGLGGVRDVRGLGLLIGVELDRPCAAVVAQALEAGLLLNVTAGNVVRLVPPLIITREEGDMMVDILVPVVRQFLQ